MSPNINAFNRIEEVIESLAKNAQHFSINTPELKALSMKALSNSLIRNYKFGELKVKKG
jgi:hypothetical protein